MPLVMLTPTPSRGGTIAAPSNNNTSSSSYHPQTGGPAAPTSSSSAADADGYMCAVCGYSVLHSHPQLLIECHYCAQWFHRACVHISERDATQIVKYACYSCSTGSGKMGGGAVSAYLAGSQQHPHQHPHGATMAAGSVYDSVAPAEFKYMSSKSPVGISSMNSNSNNRHSGGVHLYKKNADEFRHALKTGFYAKSGVRVLQSQDFTPAYFKVHPPSCEEPILVDGNNWGVAGLREPFPAIGANEISALLASSCAMRSVDVESQESFNLSTTGWNARLADCKATPVNAQFRVHDTSFRHRVAAPIAVSEVDWHFVLPSQGSSSAGSSPSTSPTSSSSPAQHHQQQMMSNPDTFGSYFGAGSFQDFAINPGGKCAWLSVSEGDTWVFLIPPTEDNLRGFEDWKQSNDPPPARVLLAEHVDHCIRCVVSKSSTLFIPSGWMYAIYSDQGCSFFSGFFSMTVSLFSQLRVLEMEASDHMAHFLSQGCLAAGWQLGDAVPQVWAALCYYVRQFLIPDPSVHVGEPDKHALVRALPYLRRWSSSLKAIKSSDTAAWTPSSLSEAQGILDRLEQALSNAMGVMPLRSMAVSHASSQFDMSTSQQRYPSLPMMGGTQGSLNRQQHLHQQQQQHQMSVSEAEYLYARGGDPSMTWPLTDASSVQPVSGFQDMHSLWHYASPEHNQLNSHPFYHQDLNSEFAAAGVNSGVPTNFTFSLPTQGGSGGGGFPVAPHHHSHSMGNDTYMDAMRQQLLGPTLPAPSAGLSHPQSFESLASNSFGSASSQDVLVRHRASCHRCGNLRKKNVRCPQCPHIFCQKCAEKMLEEHGEGIFVDGCPVCKEQCCCGKNRTILCTRKFHCYKKCPSTKKPSM